MATFMDDPIGAILNGWVAVEKAKQETRLAQANYQAAALMLPTKTSNVQTAGQSYTASPAGAAQWARDNPALAVLGLVVVGGLAWWALR